MNGNLFSGRKNFLSAISVHILVLAVISMVLLITPMAANAETGDVCIDHYQPGAVCTANDVRVVSFTPHPGTFSGCTNGIGTATFDVKVSAIGSPDRYDIGLFFSQDGTSAKTGTSCDHDFLSGVLSTTRPSIDTDADGFPDSTGTVTNPYWNGDGDSCGDVSTNSNAYRTVTLTFACVDLNGDNLIDIPVCTSWDNQASGGCTDVTGAFPGTKSKCDCQVVPSGLPISLPAITVVKSPANQAVVSGNNAAFTITVANTGTNAPLHNIIVSDPQCTTLTGPVGDTNTDSILQTTETWVYTCTTTNVTAGFINNVTASGTVADGPTVTDSDSAQVTITAPPAPMITVIKTPSNQAVVSGGTATFTLTVRNPGSVPLHNIIVSDPQCTTLTGPAGDTNTDSILQTTETWVYTCTVNNVTSAFTNTVTATGTPPSGPDVFRSATAEVAVVAPTPPTQVPTMTEWGMILFMLLAGLGSVYYLRKRKRV
jgi:uncharacterized repeat protein (TIGR01451 family)